MNYDEIFEAAGIAKTNPHEGDMPHTFTYGDLRKLVDYFVGEGTLKGFEDAEGIIGLLQGQIEGMRIRMNLL